MRNSARQTSAATTEDMDKDLRRAIELSLLDMRNSENKLVSSSARRDSKKTVEVSQRQRSPFSILSNAFSICASTKGRIEITDTLTNAFYSIARNDPNELFPAVCITSDTLPALKGVQEDNNAEYIQTDNESDTVEQNQLGVGGSSISKALRVALNCDRNKIRS